MHRSQAVADATSQQSTAHVKDIENREKRRRRHKNARRQLHHWLVIDIQQDPRREASQAERVDRSGQGVMPDLREPLPKLSDVCSKRSQIGLLRRGSAAICASTSNIQVRNPCIHQDHPRHQRYSYTIINPRHRQEEGRSHGKEAADKHRGNAEWYRHDATVLGRMAQRRDAAQEVALKGCDRTASERIRDD